MGSLASCFRRRGRELVGDRSRRDLRQMADERIPDVQNNSRTSSQTGGRSKLNIATATATEERAYTPREAAQVVKSSCSCAAALTLRAIEEYGLTLYPPRVGGKCWLAYY